MFNYINKKVILVIVIFILFLFSVIISINGKIISYSSYLGDAGFTYWTLDQNLQKLGNLNLENIFKSNIYYPYEKTLLFSDHLFTETLISAPVYILTKNSITAYNFTYVFSFVIAFFGMYLYSSIFTKEKRTKIILSIIYTFAGYSLTKLGHFQMLFHGFLPMLLYYLELCLTKKLVVKNIIFLNILLFLYTLSNAYFLVFSGIIIPLYIFLRVMFQKIKVFKLNIVITILSLILAFLLVFLASKEYLDFSNTFNVTRSRNEVVMFSPNVVDLFLPDSDNLIYGQIVRQIRPNWQFLSKKTMFPGFITFIITIIGILSLRKTKDNTFLIAFILMIFFILLSLGPELKIYNFNLQLPTLYDLIKKIYFPLEGIRALGRFYSVVYLFVIPLFGLGLMRIISLLKIKKIQTIVLIILTTLILLENVNLNVNSAYVVENKNIKIKAYLEKENKDNIYLIIPDTNVVNAINKEIPFFDVNIRNQILFRKFSVVNGYSGYTPSGLASIENYIITNGLNIQLLQALKNIGISKLVLSKYQIDNIVRDSIILDINNLKSQDILKIQFEDENWIIADILLSPNGNKLSIPEITCEKNGEIKIFNNSNHFYITKDYLKNIKINNLNKTIAIPFFIAPQAYELIQVKNTYCNSVVLLNDSLLISPNAKQ